MEKLRRLVLFTLYWCLFPPLFFIKNNGAVEKLVNLYDDPTEVLVPKNARKRIRKLLKRGRPFSALELFWSRWNPAMTENTTKPLWELCDGNKRPVVATLTVFLYSGVFLHWAGLGFMWFRGAQLLFPQLGGLSGFWVIYSYTLIGVLVAVPKAIRHFRKWREKKKPLTL